MSLGLRFLERLLFGSLGFLTPMKWINKGTGLYVESKWKRPVYRGTLKKSATSR